jgi:6-phosphogluconolactonase
MAHEMLVYVGTYTDPIRFGTGKILEGKGEGIYILRLDPDTGAMHAVGTVTGVTNPSYLAFDPTQRFLYAVNELKTYQGKPTGTVSAFAVNKATGDLTFLNRQPTHGTDPCHVLVEPKTRRVLVANFMSGSVCVLPTREDGSLEDACDFVQHQGSSIDPARQQRPHAHSVTLDQASRHAFVPDLGLDKLVVYKFDTRRGMLEPNGAPWIKMKPGAGPRHVALHRNGKFAYLINELNSTVATLAYDPRTGAFRDLQVVSTLPDAFDGGESTCSDIQVSPSGLFVYASNRGHDSIAVFRVNPRTGKLTPVEHQSTGGRTPRSFAIDPTGRFLLAANQDTDTIVTFRINPRTGQLSPTGHVTPVPTPVCVKVRLSAVPRTKGGRTWHR